MRVIAPIGVFLPTGVALEIDGNAVGRVPFTRCMPQVCMAFAEASPDTLEKMQEGQGSANFIIYEAPGIGLPMKLSLEGFSSARSTTLERAVLMRSFTARTGADALAEAGPFTYLEATVPRQRSAPMSTPPVPSLIETSGLNRSAVRGHRLRHAAAVRRTASSSSRQRQTESLVCDDGKLKSRKLRRIAGLRPARGPRRDGGLCPCAPTSASPP